MGYQALLFCPDEKLARVVSQVFSELDFTVEPLQEPFAAVKKLMAQRYDAIVVDCENEQNASLLSKAPRIPAPIRTRWLSLVSKGNPAWARPSPLAPTPGPTNPITT